MKWTLKFFAFFALASCTASYNIYDVFTSGNHGIGADVIFQNFDVISDAIDYAMEAFLPEEDFREMKEMTLQLVDDDEDLNNRSSCVSCKVQQAGPHTIDLYSQVNGWLVVGFRESWQP